MSSASSSSSSSTAPHVSHVMGYSSIRSRYPTSEKELEMEYQLRVREIRKIQEARKRMASGGGAGAGGGENERSARMNACDLNGEEFQIVCEELWIDFRRWVNHNENMSDCIDTVREAFVRNWPSICLTIGFLMLFRWYVGAGKDACSYGVGYGMLSFTCEVLRHLGELVAAILLMFIAFCVGIMPMLLCVCFYEFNDAFPDPEGNEEDDEEDDRGHIKKE
jgi:hypothetical protein